MSYISVVPYSPASGRQVPTTAEAPLFRAKSRLQMPVGDYCLTMRDDCAHRCRPGHSTGLRRRRRQALPRPLLGLAYHPCRFVLQYQVPRYTSQPFFTHVTSGLFMASGTSTSQDNNMLSPEVSPISSPWLVAYPARRSSRLALRMGQASTTALYLWAPR